ncbi:MAG: hypothetical protein ACR2HJ_09940 [Fimbriimonadales bacterium]
MTKHVIHLSFLTALLVSSCVSGSAAPSWAVQPTNADLEWGLIYEDYDGGGTGHITCEVMDNGAKFNLIYSSGRWFMEHSSQTTFEARRIISLRIENNLLEVLFDGTYHYWNEYGYQGNESGELRIFARHTNGRTRAILVNEWPLNGSEWEYGGGGYDGWTTSGTFRTW